MTESILEAAAFEFSLTSVLASLTLDPARSVEDLKTERQAATAMLAALHPTDAVQAALAARAVAMHHAAMECLRRVAQPEVPSVLASKLLATSMALSRMSDQMIRALAQRQAGTGPGRRAGPSRPAETVQPATGAANPMAGKPPAAGAAARAAGMAKDPIHQNAAAHGQGPVRHPLPMQPDLTGLTPQEAAIVTAMRTAMHAAA
jgi:hypothetical protein